MDRTRSPIGAAATLVRERLPGRLAGAWAALLLRGDARPVALCGDWAGGGAVLASEPVAAAAPGDDPFAALDRQPAVEPSDAVGGGWLGYLGFGLGRRLEPVPPGPPRPAPLPPFALAFYDHVVRRDARGDWWFEALWTPERAAALDARRTLWRARLAGAPPAAPEPPVGAFAVAPPGTAGHAAAVAECIERIAAGEIFQANLCLRLDGRFAGDPLELFARAAGALDPPYAAAVAGPWGALASLSPELFLRRRGRDVVTEPIKGTARRVAGADGDAERDRLAASAKDRAENVMIVDLMRNDLGRVCEYGSVTVEALTQPRAHPGVWHLVSTVRGRLRERVGDAALLRATFPPGSVTGAPKVRALRVIAELEATGREAYTGAIGYASPCGGLELNVAIRTFEVADGRIWLGAGGGVVADSEPDAEVRECLVKAAPLVAAAGGRIVAPRPGAGPAPEVPRAVLVAGRDRPDPACGVFETVLVRAGRAVALRAHLARLATSLRTLYGAAPPDDLEARVLGAARGDCRVRILADPGGDVEVEAAGLPASGRPVTLTPYVLPGGLGAHKWRDRRLLDALGAGGTVALLVDLDGCVLEAAHANVFAREGPALVTPPADGRILPGTTRARLLASGRDVREEPLTLARLAAADAIVLTSALRGEHPARLGP